MKISILLATHNGSKYIDQSIESVLSQTYQDWELLIGLNDTSDNTLEKLKLYTDDRIKIFEYAERGKPNALNCLLKESVGEYIAIIDDDDIWLPEKLEFQINSLNDDYADVIGTQMFYCDENGNILDGSPSLARSGDNIRMMTLMGDNQIANLSALVNRNSLVAVGGWRNLIALEDFDLWVRMCKANYSFKNLNEKLVIHRRHNNSKFNTMRGDIQEQIKNEILNG